MEGTYQLPEAQLDRFLFKVLLDYPSEDELVRILDTTTRADAPVVTPVLDPVTAPARVEAMRRLVREVLVAPDVERYAASLVRLTVPATGGRNGVPDTVARYVAYGASPRGAQSLVLGAKALALLAGRPHAMPADVERVALAALRHRLVFNFAAEAASVEARTVVEDVLAAARAGRP
jgi:MoxR-like ATPase